MRRRGDPVKRKGGKGGVWYADYYEHGKRIRFSLGLPAKAPMSWALKELEARQREAKLPGGGAIPIKQALDSVVRAVEARLKAGTADKYRYVLDHFEKFLTRERRRRFLHEIIAADIQEYAIWRSGQLVHKRARLVSPGAVNSELRTIRAALGQLWDRGELAADPSRWFKNARLPEPEREIRIYSDSEMATILREAEPHYGRVYKFLWLTGIRLSEALSLRWIDVRKDHIVVHGKGGKINKHPIFTEEQRAFLKELRAESKGDLVFTGKDGRPLVRWSVTRHLQEILRRHKWRHGTVHDIRRTFCSKLANAGVPLQILISLTGHSSAKVLLDHYYKPSMEAKIDALKRAGMGQLWANEIDEGPQLVAVQ